MVVLEWKKCLTTVIAPDALTGDAWATALSVMEPEKGLALVEDLPGVQARIELRTSDPTIVSSGWPQVSRETMRFFAPGELPVSHFDFAPPSSDFNLPASHFCRARYERV